jgi:hypothetical protein
MAEWLSLIRDNLDFELNFEEIHWTFWSVKDLNEVNIFSLTHHWFDSAWETL